MNLLTRLLLVSVLLSGLLVACRAPGPGAASGQVKHIAPDGGVRNLAGAQVVLRGTRDTLTTVTTAGEGSGDQADGSYNYRFENLPPGRYTMAVTPPAGSGLQPEDDIHLEVKADEVYPQSVLLLTEGLAKPQPIPEGELGPGENGYVNGRGERVVYHNSGPDLTDFLLMYMLFRNPIGYGYGAPPVVVGGPRSPTSTGPSYRVESPPTTTSNGQKVTQRPPSVPGQGATRPGAAPASGSGATTRPSTNGSSPSQVDSRSSSAPSQGVSRPSSPPSGSSGGSPSRSSGGGRK